MNNNNDYKDIAAIISIIKFCTLLYIMLVIKSSYSNNLDYFVYYKEF